MRRWLTRNAIEATIRCLDFCVVICIVFFFIFLKSQLHSIWHKRYGNRRRKLRLAKLNNILRALTLNDFKTSTIMVSHQFFAFQSKQIFLYERHHFRQRYAPGTHNRCSEVLCRQWTFLVFSQRIAAAHNFIFHDDALSLSLQIAWGVCQKQRKVYNGSWMMYKEVPEKLYRTLTIIPMVDGLIKHLQLLWYAQRCVVGHSIWWNASIRTFTLIR